jgi:2-polyprenyl-3-methyl-5-hydroxy-6-metoxy-1,4-benzoquinol methylase
LTKNSENLFALLKVKSKHGHYQSFHPLLNSILENDLQQPAGKNEESRQSYMEYCVPLSGKRILDIGANTGYFSFAAVNAGAEKLISVEGNLEHATFIQEAAKMLGFSNKIEVKSVYYDFSEDSRENFDVALCLNVLHHLGDDFGNKNVAMQDAKVEMISGLNRLAKRSKFLWLQLGFNWKGDRNSPLFENGSKDEVIQFIQDGVVNFWDVRNIAVANPISLQYEPLNQSNSQKFDKLGEFLNRPLFLLSSKLLPSDLR